MHVSKSTFSPSGNGLDLWNQLGDDGGLTLKLEQKKTSGIFSACMPFDCTIVVPS